MNKKEFELIANTLRGQYDLDISDLEKYRVGELIDNFADVLESTYPSFHKEKFLTACGVGE